MSNIDKEVFNKLKERMKEKFPVLLGGYLRDAKTYLVTVETNIPDGDISALIAAVHSLKSASGLLGITEVFSGAEKLEYTAKEIQEKGGQNFHSLGILYAELQNMFSEVEGDLRAELEKARAAWS